MSSTPPPPISSASVRNILTLLISRDAQLVAGVGGLEHRVTWACRMRARLPAFESVHGGELALLSLPQLRRLDETLPHLLKSLHKEGVAVVAVAAASLEALGSEACTIADQLHLPLILLPPEAPLQEIEREVITFVVGFRSEIERKASEISHQLMQLSAQGAGVKGICEHLADSCGRWVIVQDAEKQIRFKAAPPGATGEDMPSFTPSLTDEALLRQGLVRVAVPILIRHEAVGYLSLIGSDDFDYLERLVLGQVAPILALEFARERERSEVESRYHLEAFMDVLQGNYQQPEEMLTRARLLGYDLTTPQVVVIFELPASDPEPATGTPMAQWNRRFRDELLRAWPTCWVLNEPRRVTALLPLASIEEGAEQERESENSIFARLERVHARLQQKKNDNSNVLYSGGMGHIARNLQGIARSLREAQQALEIGRRLFGDGQIHSFARLGIYRLLFYLHEQSELADFYQETLGPLIHYDSHSNSALIETLEAYFRCNGNLSETARAMHLHRNSLLYRLGRIEEILGRSLEDSELRLSMQIALKIRHLLKD